VSEFTFESVETISFKVEQSEFNISNTLQFIPFRYVVNVITIYVL